MLGDDFRHETAAAFQQTRLSVNRHTHLLFPSLHTCIIDIHYIKISDNCQVCKFKIIRFIIYFFCAITTYTRDYKLKYNRMTVKLFIFSDVNKQRELSKCTISMFQISAKCSTKTSVSNICPFSCYNCLEFKHIMSYNRLEKMTNPGNTRKLFYVISLSLKIREIPRLFTEQKILTYERKKKYVFSRSRADIFRKRRRREGF